MATRRKTPKTKPKTRPATSLNRPPKPPKSQPAPFQTKTRPASPTAAVGQGAFAIVGEAARRLDQSKSYAYPGGPLPFAGQQEGESVVTPQRLWYYKLTRWNPIKQLKPETLAHYFDLFQQGYLRYFALMADAIEHRDPLLMSVIGKRKASVKRLQWEIIKRQDLTPAEDAQADDQKEKLESFYNGAQATSAVDLNVRGGMPMLLDFALNALGHKYATFEVIWKPTPDGDLTAQFNFIPLWFFENRTGKLRFLTMDYSIDGTAMRDGSFVTFTGQGLMEPCAVAYMFKSLAITQWMIYCEKTASMTVWGKTDAPTGSDYWNSFASTLNDIAPGMAIVSGLKDEIEKLSFAGTTAQDIYHAIVDYFDRCTSALWRGADLSTMSARSSSSGSQGGGQGASLQGKEEYYIQCSDAQAFSEVFNTQVDNLVLKWHFGEDVKPLCYFKLVVPPNVDAQADIAIINALLSWGVTEIGQNQMMEHFGIAQMMKKDEPCVTPNETMMQTQQKYMPEMPGVEGAANEEQRFHEQLGVLVANAHRTRDMGRLVRAGVDMLAKETYKALTPLRAAMETALAANELGAFQKLRSEVPGIISEINKDPANARPIAETMAAAWFNGLFMSAIKK